jgi:hypothetical protein
MRNNGSSFCPWSYRPQCWQLGRRGALRPQPERQVGPSSSGCTLSGVPGRRVVEPTCRRELRRQGMRAWSRKLVGQIARSWQRSAQRCTRRIPVSMVLPRPTSSAGIPQRDSAGPEDQKSGFDLMGFRSTCVSARAEVRPSIDAELNRLVSSRAKQRAW